MTQSMIERVARAVLASHEWTEPTRFIDGIEVAAPADPWDRLSPDWQEVYRKGARAAILAMRTPTDEMLEAAWRHTAHVVSLDQRMAHELANPKASFKVKLAQRWKAAIDQALNPSPSTPEGV